jgi:hypothetical protein
MRERKKKKEEKKKHGKINQSISINQSIKPTNQSNQSSINKQCGIKFSASMALVPLLIESGHTRIELNQTTESADRPAIDRLADRFAREYKQHCVQNNTATATATHRSDTKRESLCSSRINSDRQ